MIIILFRLSYLAEVPQKCIDKFKIDQNKAVDPRGKIGIVPFPYQNPGYAPVLR